MCICVYFNLCEMSSTCVELPTYCICTQVYLPPRVSFSTHQFREMTRFPQKLISLPVWRDPTHQNKPETSATSDYVGISLSLRHLPHDTLHIWHTLSGPFGFGLYDLSCPFGKHFWSCELSGYKQTGLCWYIQTHAGCLGEHLGPIKTMSLRVSFMFFIWIQYFWIFRKCVGL